MNTNVAGAFDAYARMKRNVSGRVQWGEVSGKSWSGEKVDRTSAKQKATNKKIAIAKAFNVDLEVNVKNKCIKYS